MCWSYTPVGNVRITRNVAGLITLTVPDSLFGTYTRSGTPRTAGLNIPARIPAYTFLDWAGDRGRVGGFAAGVTRACVAAVGAASVSSPNPKTGPSHKPNAATTEPRITPATRRLRRTNSRRRSRCCSSRSDINSPDHPPRYPSQPNSAEGRAAQRQGASPRGPPNHPNTRPATVTRPMSLSLKNPRTNRNVRATGGRQMVGGRRGDRPPR